MGSFSGSYHTKQLLSNIIENSKINKICVYILKVIKTKKKSKLTSGFLSDETDLFLFFFSSGLQNKNRTYTIIKTIYLNLLNFNPIQF